MKIAVIIALLLCLLAGPVSAITDLGYPAVTRLWVATETGNKFACTGFYVRPLHARGAWLVSAGHCTMAQYAARSANDHVLSAIDWRVSFTTHRYAGKLYDLAVATLPDVRDDKDKRYYSLFAPKFPAEGARLFIHGFPAGAESIALARAGKQMDKTGTYEIVLDRAGSIVGGSSGSPVLDEQGYLVGVVWGIKLQPDPETGQMHHTTIAYVTPVEVLHGAIALLELEM